MHDGQALVVHRRQKGPKPQSRRSHGKNQRHKIRRRKPSVHGLVPPLPGFWIIITAAGAVGKWKSLCKMRIFCGKLCGDVDKSQLCLCFFRGLSTFFQIFVAFYGILRFLLFH
jgi:hypothetical protein